jgi:hypothetical protein
MWNIICPEPNADVDAKHRCNANADTQVRAKNAVIDGGIRSSTEGDIDGTPNIESGRYWMGSR